MTIEVYDLSINFILVARVIALLIFLYVAWRLACLQRKINHIEVLTENNFSELQIRLADAIGVAEESVIRDEQRHERHEINGT